MTKTSAEAMTENLDLIACACPVISAFLRSWNDALSDAERDTLLHPLLPLLIGSRGSDALAYRRSLMAADWLVRVHTPAWLRLAKLDAHADALASLPEITDLAQVPSIRRLVKAARRDAAAARGAARSTACSAPGDAAGAAAAAAAWDATAVAAWDVTWATAWATAWDAARDAAEDATWAALAPTRLALQQSAFELVKRMIALTTV